MIPISRRKVLAATLGGLFLSAALETASRAETGGLEYPHVLVTPEGRDALREKVARFAWAKAAYQTIKTEMDYFAGLCEKQPDYLTSRLLLNWNTHYTQNFVQKDRWVRGDGFAPVPTPRFAGARDWATPWNLPSKIEDFRPFNDAPDKSGMVWLLNKDTKKEGWTHPSPTGRTIEVGNARLMELASRAAFMFFMEGDARYARMASGVFTTYLTGFSYVAPPVDLGGPNRIIGTSSFEVIHDAIVRPIGLTYDFLRPYLMGQKQNTALMEAQMKRMCDRIIDGGNAEGNWNLNQAFNFVYAGLALQNNDAYADKKGRQYYAEVLLNAKLPNQTGIVHVINEGYDRETALWPEAPGYGFGTTPQMLRFATLLQNDPNGAKLLQNPFLTRAIFAQQEMLFPDGYSCGLGDTTNARISTEALETGIASARQRRDTATEARLTAALQSEIAQGYDRNKQTDLFSLTHFVGDLRPGADKNAAQGASRTYFGEPLNVFFQRNLAPSGNALAATLYGTKGGHIHINGMAMELFGAGLILGADPGRGASYWTPDHGQYYMRPQAHNTVVVNGESSYGAKNDPHGEVTLVLTEPESQTPGLSQSVSVAVGTMTYEKPVAAHQRRTLAVVRTGDKTGFYFDVFRSRAQKEAGSSHDYFYHNMGQRLTLANDEKALPLAPSQTLADPKLPKAYGYFKNERTAESENGGFCATFSAKTGELPGDHVAMMQMWMVPGPNRQIFALDAPKNNAARHLPPILRDAIMPTALVRQTGDAWTSTPFVAVYEPYIGANGPSIKAVRSMPAAQNAPGFAACMVEGTGFHVCLLDCDETAQKSEQETQSGVRFQGAFGTVRYQNDTIEELYLADGVKLEVGEVGVYSQDKSAKSSVSLRRDGGDWTYSAHGPVRVRVVFALPEGKDMSRLVLACEAAPGQKPTQAQNAQCRAATGAGGQKMVVAEGTVPAGQSVSLRLVSTV